ncbi:phosphonate ABC transporter, permease protein PhnE [Anaerocolumna cellulosilytica]|uniref:Phosphonate ABC transporter, permease protein PhnE n=1 Tax=Anaerocolumna cellulosilytica TaxID=433286 RepID=A0A6S6QZC4_9FIRM|nr:phosphonate ABC transporter, permease protein PhnE [Anaerocolumna cellulosilytica]MBB5195471.1 phosphonate transport system permease protein [Anaerocolumna cellulosilytica]BCJ96004.1 phosphonate ABC transporter, permease protein PhnE [Anaerocolumna cellulosilytica]
MESYIRQQYEQRPKKWLLQLVTVLIVIMLLVWSGSMLELNGVKQNGIQVAKNILKGILHPDTKLLFNFTKAGVAYLLFETICIAFLGTIVGAILAIPFSFLSAFNIVPAPIALIGRFIIMAVRTIPAFVYGLMFIRVTGPGPFAGLLTISVCSIGMLSKMYIETLEDLDMRILESLDAAGLNTFQKIRYGILPQLIPNFLSIALYRFDMNLRDAAVLGLVAAGGIGAPLIFAMNSYRWNEVGAILTGLILLVLIIEVISTKIRVKLTRG